MTPVDLESLSRREFARLVALLTGRFGSDRLESAEDAVQDAFAAAVRVWGPQGPPSDPAAWLYRVARNRMIDRLRRVEPDVLPDEPAAVEPDPVAGDSELRLILLCCHPSLSTDSQIALTLKLAGGFSVGEIARLLRAAEDAVDQRLVRARKTLRAAGPALEIPAIELPARAAVAREAIYAMFSEGYASISAPSGLRRELCFEALRLVGVMLADPATRSPDLHALAALFALQASRLDERLDDAGGFRSLRDQDRSRWDRNLIDQGMDHLHRSIGAGISRYHVEAEIASCHAEAATYQDTDWARIVELYDLLAERWGSPVVSLNRAIAIGERDGPAEGLAALEALGALLGDDPLWHAAMADQEERLGRAHRARRHAESALSLARAPAVRRAIENRLGRLRREADVGSGAGDPS